MSIGKNIKKYRNLENITQSELASKLKLSVHAIRKYEQNEREPNYATIENIARALNVNVVQLLNRHSSGILISYVRRRKGISESEFASILEISEEELLTYESDIQDMPLNLIIKSAILLQESMGSFINDYDLRDRLRFLVIKNAEDIELHFKDKISSVEYNNILEFLNKNTKNIERFNIKDKELQAIEACHKLTDIYKYTKSVRLIREDVLLKIVKSDEFKYYLSYIYDVFDELTERNYSTGVAVLPLPPNPNPDEDEY